MDGSGSAYLTGYTKSTNFPTASPLQSTRKGAQDAFVTKVNGAGSALVYSTYHGGNSNDWGIGIAVDSSHNAYVTGVTHSSSGFPLANALQSTFGGGTADAYVTKFNSSASALTYSTYVGGSFNDEGLDIAVDSSGNAYIAGDSDSTNFPTVNAWQGTKGGGVDAIAAKINAAGSALDYSSYHGGSATDIGRSIAVDSGGNAYMTGWTFSSNFPTVNPLQGTYGGTEDAFVVKIGSGGGGGGGLIPPMDPSPEPGPSSEADRLFGDAEEGFWRAVALAFEDSKASSAALLAQQAALGSAGSGPVDSRGSAGGNDARSSSADRGGLEATVAGGGAGGAVADRARRDRFFAHFHGEARMEATDLLSNDEPDLAFGLAN